MTGLNLDQRNIQRSNCLTPPPQQNRSVSMRCRPHRSHHQKRQLSSHHIFTHWLNSNLPGATFWFDLGDVACYIHNCYLDCFNHSLFVLPITMYIWNLNCRRSSWMTTANSHQSPSQPPDTKSPKISYFCNNKKVLGKHCIVCFQNVKLTTISFCKFVRSTADHFKPLLKLKLLMLSIKAARFDTKRLLKVKHRCLQICVYKQKYLNIQTW